MAQKQVTLDLKIDAMTSEADISEQVTKLYNKFWFSQYDASLPSGLISKFREAIMMHTAMSLQGAPAILRDLIGAKEEDLKFVHVGIILNTLFSVPLNTIFFSPEEALDSIIEYKEIEIQYNKLVEKKSKEIEKTRARLLELGGITKSVNFNGKN